MNDILNERIKTVIKRNPAVGELLNEFGVACVDCAVGTCLLKDILDIHRLSPEDERKLMSGIARIVYPHRDIELPARHPEPPPAPRARRLSPPLQRLVDEHTLIKRLLALIPDMARELDLEREQDRQWALGAVDFIRSYADRFHHAKEEDILFKDAGDGQDIIQVMLADHETGRGYVRAIVEAVERHDTAAAVENLLAYRELLTEHIKKEDEILYPWLDQQLTDTQIGQLFAAFDAAEKPMADARRRSEAFIIEAERCEQLRKIGTGSTKERKSR